MATVQPLALILFVAFGASGLAVSSFAVAGLVVRLRGKVPSRALMVGFLVSGGATIVITVAMGVAIGLGLVVKV
ncbi:hypothetical protein [Pseudolysinimonas yzui]|uniref:Uncharacterized protein n=1 Tax=Pseudolysinimonas yzui TaxID=2708254 RepID=A0A8J3DYC6_9MICO|nr:hypothetical protein [Pseudolysinimonas yzui]GHF04452.1 hypothetical protein GCM10011600_01050 [Pseudolysinimonas yzui]